MQKHTSFRLVILVVLGTWLLVNGIAQTRVGALQTTTLPPAVPQGRPLQQACTTGPDLVIQSVVVEPNPPFLDTSYNVRVEITNDGIVTGTFGTRTYLYVDRQPDGSPDVDQYSETGGLASGSVITTYLTVPASQATAGYHSVSVEIDALGNVPESASCGGENNNTATTGQFEIQGVPTSTPVPPTATSFPTSTPFPAPQIYFFNPGNVTISRGESVTLHWQVYGDSVTVTLDGAPVPLEDSRIVYPTENHVYTLRVENPGGLLERTCNITVIDPTATPTPTPTSCPLATIHQFNASPTTIFRGQQTTLYWDLAGATEAYLNGKGVAGVSSQVFTLDQTTIFTLIAHNACGDVQKTLKITVNYATPTRTRTPTYTPRPTSTPRPTNTPRPPTATPTRNVLPTLTSTSAPLPTGTQTPTPTPNLGTPPTQGPQQPTITPGVTSTSSTFNSPLPSPTSTMTTQRVEPTATETPIANSTEPSTTVASGTPASTSTRQLSTVTPKPVGFTATPTPRQPTLTPSPQSVAQNVAPTTQATVVDVTPTLLPTPVSGAGSMRMYLCPLGILIVFAVSVLVLSIVLPRVRALREDRKVYPLEQADIVFDPNEPLPSTLTSLAGLFSDTPFSEGTASIEAGELIPEQKVEASAAASRDNDLADTGAEG